MRCTSIVWGLLLLLALTACSSVPQQQQTDNDNRAAATPEYERAVAALQAGHTDEALQRFLRLAKSYPQLAGPFANLGLLYQQQGEQDKAAAAFDRAVSLQPDSGEIYNAAALFYRSAGRFDDAETAYRNAIEHAPASADPVLNLAILYDLYLKQPRQAIKYYRRYLAMLDHEDKRVAMWLADLQRRENSGR